MVSEFICLLILKALFNPWISVVYKQIRRERNILCGSPNLFWGGIKVEKPFLGQRKDFKLTGAKSDMLLIRNIGFKFLILSKNFDEDFKKMLMTRKKFVRF